MAFDAKSSEMVVILALYGLHGITQTLPGNYKDPLLWHERHRMSDNGELDFLWREGLRGFK